MERHIRRRRAAVVGSIPAPFFPFASATRRPSHRPSHPRTRRPSQPAFLLMTSIRIVNADFR